MSGRAEQITYHNRGRAWLILLGMLTALLVPVLIAPATAQASSLPPPPVFIPPASPDDDRPLRPPLYARSIVYKVKEGDTIWDIAQTYGVDPETLAVINGMTNWNRLAVGQHLRILTLTGLLHRVRPDESLDQIAEKYQVNIDEIVEVNCLKDENSLREGQELIIPGARPPREAVLAAKGMLYRWPTRGRISSYFGYRWGRPHTGIDIAAPTGTPVVASRDGTVRSVGWLGRYGKTVVVRHSDGNETLYAHLSAILVSSGQWVEQGSMIGRVGSTGNSTGPHLHFEIRIGGRPRNPLDFLSR